MNPEARVTSGTAGLFDRLLPPVGPAPQAMPEATQPQPVSPAHTTPATAEVLAAGEPVPAAAAPAVSTQDPPAVLAQDQDADLALAMSLGSSAGAGQMGTAKPGSATGAALHPSAGRVRSGTPIGGDTSAGAMPIVDPAQLVVLPPPQALPPPASAPAAAGPPAPLAGAAPAMVAATPRPVTLKRQSVAAETPPSASGGAERLAAKAPFPSAVASAAASPPPVGDIPVPAPALAVAAAGTAAPACVIPVPTDAEPAKPGPAGQVQPVLLRVVGGSGSQAITVSLHPAELGQVEVRVERGNTGSVQVALIAARPETLHALVRDQAQLSDALARAGVPQDSRSLTFHLAQAEPPTGAPDEPPGPAPPPAPPSQPHGGAMLAGGGSSGQNPGSLDQGGQDHGGQEGGRYRPGLPVNPESAFAAGDAGGPQPARWLRLGIDITA